MYQTKRWEREFFRLAGSFLYARAKLLNGGDANYDKVSWMLGELGVWAEMSLLLKEIKGSYD